MTRETAQAIAGRIPGAVVVDTPDGPMVRKVTLGLVTVATRLDDCSAITFNTHGWTVADAGLLDEIKAAAAEFSSAIAAAVADGFPDPREERNINA